MSKLTISIAVITLVSSVTAFAGTHTRNVHYQAADNSYASKMCVVAATGNKYQLDEQVKALKPTTLSKQNYRYVASNVTCNGEDLVNFALNAGNYKIAKTLAKHREGNVRIQDLAVNTQAKGLVLIEIQ